MSTSVQQMETKNFPLRVMETVALRMRPFTGVETLALTQPSLGSLTAWRAVRVALYTNLAQPQVLRPAGPCIRATTAGAKKAPGRSPEPSLCIVKDPCLH